MQVALHGREVVFESSGRFTICGSRELRRLSQFRLPNSDWWVLKILQGMVSLGARELSIVCTATATEFEADWQGKGLLERLELALWQADQEVEPALEHLRQALWSEGFASKRPFRLSAPYQSVALCWDGQALGRQPQTPPSRLKLVLWHARSWSFLRSLAVRQIVLRQLRERAFFCGVPLTVNGRRLDGLACTFEEDGFAYPVALGFCPGRGAELTIPLIALLESKSLRSGPLSLCRVLVHASQMPSRTLVASLIRLHPNGSLPNRSTLLWVRDGVVVDEEALEISRSCFSFVLFASAEGLASDPGGFRLLRDRNYATRFRQVLGAALPYVGSSEISLRDWLAQQKLHGRLRVAAVLAAAVSTAYFLPHPAWLLLMAALWLFHPADICEQEREFELKASFARMQSDYRRMLASQS